MMATMEGTEMTTKTTKKTRRGAARTVAARRMRRAYAALRQAVEALGDVLATADDELTGAAPRAR